MIKYKIEFDGKKIEFLTESEASNYLAINGLTGVDIVEFDDPNSTAVKAKVLPDLTPRQVRQVLILNGISLATIDAMIDSMPDVQKHLAKIEWEYSVSIKRTNPLVSQMAAGLGLTQEQVDSLWIQGLTL